MSETYNPNWNPDDYDMTLKYEPMSESHVNKILIQYKHDEILDYIKQLWKLINYQKQIIWEQRKEIIAIKHQEAWKRYDKHPTNYDAQTRKYVDKPTKSDTMDY